MLGSATAALAFLPFVVPIGLWVAWNDMKHMKIPNKAVAALLVVFLLVGPLVLPFETYLWRWVHFAVVLAIGFVLNLMRLVGAGDAKFAAAMAPFIAVQDLVPLMWLFAGVVLAAYVTHRGLRAVPAVQRATPDWTSWQRRRDFPMGLALGPTLIFYVALPLLPLIAPGS